MSEVIAVVGAISAVLGAVAAWLEIQGFRRSRTTPGRRGATRRDEMVQQAKSWATTERRRRTDDPGTYPAVALGSLSIDASLRVGSLATSWGPGSISCLYDPDRRFIPDPDTRAAMVHALERRLAEYRTSGTVAFDGPSYALRDIRVEVVDPIEESTRLELLLGPLTYFDFVATNLSVRSGDLPKAVTWGLRSTDLVDLPLSNQLAMNISLVTTDQRLVLQRRSRAVTHFPGYLANGINGTMQRGTDGHNGDETEDGLPDPFLTIRRECLEELGIAPDPAAVRIYGLAVEHRFFQPLLIGEARLDVSSDELRSIAGTWARDKFEYLHLETLPLDPAAIATSLDDDRWVPICALTTVATCVQRLGREVVTAGFTRPHPIRVE